MKILFVWPAAKNVELLNILPLGLGYLAANIPREYERLFWDGILSGETEDRVIDTVRSLRPDVVAVSVWRFNLEAARDIIDLIKKNYPSVTIAVGGVEPSGQRGRILETLNADYAFAGEGEGPFSKFLELVNRGALNDEEKRKIDGLIFRDADRKIVCNDVRWEALDGIRYCDYEFIKLDQYLASGYYYGLYGRARRVAPIMATRGCPFSCAYCSARLVNGCRVRTRPVHSVIDEIKELHQKHRVNGFNIIDDNFTAETGFAKEMCQAIIGLGLKDVSFHCPNGVRYEYLDKELLDLMKKAGWEWVSIAPESGSEKTLLAMNKNVQWKLVKEKARMIKESGLKVFGFFMIGYPGETEEDIGMTIDAACRNDFDVAVFTCFQPLSGTPVYNQLLASGEVDDSAARGDYFRITYAPRGMSVGRLKFLRMWGLFKFYTSSFERFRNVFLYNSPRRLFFFIKKYLM